MLGIIIVNYNDWDNLKNCLKSIVLDISYRIYIVDNASRHNSFSKELINYDNTTLITSDTNRGYSAGNNLGLKQAIKDGCDFFLISNTDIVFSECSIERLIFSLQNRECDIVGPKIYLSNKKIQEQILGIRITPIEKLKLIFNSATKDIMFKNLKSNFNNKHNIGLIKYKVYGLSGCCFAFNKFVAEEILPFDENIFLYNEEWLLAEKCFKKGLITLINNESEVLHLHGSTTKSLKFFAYKCFVKSEKYLLNMCFPGNVIINNLIYITRLPKLFIKYFKETSCL